MSGRGGGRGGAQRPPIAPPRAPRGPRGGLVPRGGGRAAARGRGGAGRAPSSAPADGRRQTTFAPPLVVPRPGEEIEISGRWWNGAAPAERNALYPVKVLQNAPNHLFAGRAAPGVRIDLLDALGGRTIEGSGGWMTLKCYNDYKAEHETRVEEQRVSAIAARLIGGDAAAGGGGGEGGDAGDAGESEAPAAPARYASLIRKFFEYTGV